MAEALARGAEADAREDGAARIVLAGRAFLADPLGGLYWPDRDTLIAADLHLEKGSSLARRGAFLPPYDTAAGLESLARLLDRYGPGRVICLGDSFHDRDGPDRMAGQDHARLRALQAGRDWWWIRGNHDPDLPPRAGGRVVGSVAIDGIAFRHEPDPDRAGPQIAGHLHPAARLRRQGASVRRKCFAGDGRRLVLPALGAYAGGLDVLDPAFEALFGGGAFHVWMLGRDRVYRVSSRQLGAASRVSRA